MANTETYTGGCLCGSVRYRVHGDPAWWQSYCYCTNCRKYSGSVGTALMAVSSGQMELTGELKFHAVPTDSGNTVRHGFCPECGSAVMNSHSCKPEMRIIHAGSLDDPEQFKPQMSIYTSCAPSWNIPDVTLPKFDKMPTK